MASRNDLCFPSDNDDSGYRKDLLKKLYEAALIGDDTDVVLVFGKFGEIAPKLHVHSTILKTESEVFKRWMTAECWNNELIKSADGKTMISLPADDLEEFKSFLMLMYGQKGLIMKNEIHTVCIPAFKIADKYGALGVMKIWEEECFPALIRNFDNLNIAQVYAFAQKYSLTSVANAVIEFVKKHPMRDLVEGEYASDWILSGSGEEVLIRLLSTDSYVLLPGALDWSGNEFKLCRLALRWLKKRSEMALEEDKEEDDEDAEKGPSSRKLARVDGASAIAVRVLQNIRFRQMTPEYLNSCLSDLHDFLTLHQIGTICLVFSGASQDNIKSCCDGEKFIVNTKLRR